MRLDGRELRGGGGLQVTRLLWTLWSAVEFALFPWALLAFLLREAAGAIQGMSAREAQTAP